MTYQDELVILLQIQTGFPAIEIVGAATSGTAVR